MESYVLNKTWKLDKNRMTDGKEYFRYAENFSLFFLE